MRFKKGQTATEYLIILAVVIVIALIVVGVLGGIPSIGGGAKANSANSYWRTSTPIGITSTKVVGDGTNGNVTLVIRNNGADSITVNGVTLTNSAGTVAGQNGSALGEILTAGGTASFYVMGAVEPSEAGEAFSYGVSINYTDSATGGLFTFTGDGNKLEGSVANS